MRQNDYHLSTPVTLTFDLIFFDLKIVLLVTRDVGNLSSKFECCTVFGLRVNGGHGTTAGCRLTRYAASRSA